jgi:hypothetical protein
MVEQLVVETAMARMIDARRLQKADLLRERRKWRQVFCGSLVVRGCTWRQ